jgi:pimeloyl-ACP methyl ester carboxylesterase
MFASPLTAYLLNIAESSGSIFALYSYALMDITPVADQNLYLKELFMRYLVAIFALLCLILPITAQEPEAALAEITASDGQVLKGDWYAPANAPEDGAPAILLLHMYGSNRIAYAPLIVLLHDAGYAILNVDLRGFGQSRGKQDWAAAQTDVQLWLDWLREQDGVRDDQLATIGASVGANLALVGCSNDEGCVTTIALSPGISFYGIQPEDAVVTGLSKRSVLLVASHFDNESSIAVRQMGSKARNDVLVRIYPGSAHGTSLFNREMDSLGSLILLWLDQHLTIED